MGIKRQKASAIMQSLLIDLAATGANDALAIIRKAWTIESPLNNLQDALGELNDAIKHTDALLKVMSYLTKEGVSLSMSVKGGISRVVLVDQKVKDAKVAIEEMIELINRGLVALEASTGNYWRESGHLLLKEIHDKLGALIGSSFKYPVSDATSLELAYSILRDDLTDARDEIENAMEAAGIDPAVAPAAAPSGASANASATSEGGSSNPSLDAYNRHILGGKKALEDFFTKYKVEADPKAYGFNRPAHEIVKKYILDNKDIKSLMIHADKHDKPESLKQLLNISKFAAAAEALRSAVNAQIKTASSELDALPPVLPGV